MIGQCFYNINVVRVKKVTNAETTIFVYSSGKLVAEYSTQIAPPSEARTSYTTTDHLGSPRIITDQFGQVKSRRDFMPFGEELNAGIGNRTGDSGLKYSSSTDNVRQKFTGYQKDAETSLDFAEARMYENRYGRFTAVDPTLGSIKAENPQTLNRYTYALNNPLAYIDPDGQEPLIVGNWSDLSKDQQRLFITYVQHNYSDRLGDWKIEDFAANMWNASAIAANMAGSDTLEPGTSYFPLLQQSQLTTFLATTSMLEARGVIGEIDSVTTINGDQAKDSFRILGELKYSSSAKKIFEAFDWKIGGSDKGDYKISRREQGPFGQPNGHVTLTTNLMGVNVDVDYRALYRVKAHNTKENSDIRADDGDTSHYRRHVKRYGPISALTPVNPNFVRQK